MSSGRMRCATWGILLALLLAQSVAHAVDQSSTLIWPQIAQGMRLGGESQPSVRRWIAHYQSHPQALRQLMARAEPFLWFIVNTAELREMPTELALLPAIESGWDAHAVSSASAKGLWQFVPSTGVAYGLKNTARYNAVRDPIASTRAALTLLAALQRQYGDWCLALAAYNAGSVRVDEAIRRSGQRSFWRLPLPPATREYVPQLLALAALVREPYRYGVRLPAVHATGVAEMLPVTQPLLVSRALQSARISGATLQTYNPGFDHGGGGPVTAPALLLPPADALAVRAELAEIHRPERPSPTPETCDIADAKCLMRRPLLTNVVQYDSASVGGAGLHWNDQLASQNGALPYLVDRGDTWDSIAQRYGMTVDKLCQLNATNRDTVLQAGQQLRVAGCRNSECG